MPLDKCKDDEFLYWWRTVLDIISHWTQPEPIDWHWVANLMAHDVRRLIGDYAEDEALRNALLSARSLVPPESPLLPVVGNRGCGVVREVMN